MIRMGRSSKTEPVSNTNEYQETPANLNSSYQVSPGQPQSTRAISESESMARDIKEGRLSGFVGNGTVLTGETNFQAMLRVDGHLTGRVSSENGTLIVGSTGKVDADINVAATVINGTVNGDITASEKIELGRTARVVGNIQTPRLLIDDGAILDGSCAMLKAREASDKQVEQPNSYSSANNYSKFETAETEKPDEPLDSAEEAEEETAQSAVN